MDLIKKTYPFIDELVDSLYIDKLNNLIDKNCKTIEDKKIFIMFIITYFMTYLNTPNITSDGIKEFLNNIIKNPEERLKYIKLFYEFDENRKLIK